jgi:hypothetical protein
MYFINTLTEEGEREGGDRGKGGGGVEVQRDKIQRD